MTKPLNAEKHIEHAAGYGVELRYEGGVLTPLGAATARAFWLNVRPDRPLAGSKDDDDVIVADDDARAQALDAVAVAIAGAVEDLASAIADVV